MADLPHPLNLYRLAVQHPLAEVAFIEHAWQQTHGDVSEPLLLREDFSGTCAVAAAWVASDLDRQAMAIEIDPQTAQWAADTFDDPDLHIVVDDVVNIDGPMVDVTVSLNFSTLIYHDRNALLGYLNNARQSLNPGGLLIMELFGGPSTRSPSVQKRRIEPDEGGFEPFEYTWQQGAASGPDDRIACSIHFDLGGGNLLADAFVYDWRLWRPGQLIEAAIEAGFAQASLWWAPPDTRQRFMPVDGPPEDEDWVAYVVCQTPE